MTMTTVQGGRRLCGSGRTAGETYLECAVGASGQQLLVDIPDWIEPEMFGLSDLGVRLITDPNGVTHVLDIVGRSYYPEVADFIEESHRMGISRKLSSAMPVKGLTRQSKLFLIHARALVGNAADLPEPADFVCPCRLAHSSTDGCLGWAWHATPNAGPGAQQLVGATYRVRSAIPDEAVYQHAIFMAAPIQNLTVIRSPDAHTEAARLAHARTSGVPVLLADE